jgi:hypothetical protein
MSSTRSARSFSAAISSPLAMLIGSMSARSRASLMRVSRSIGCDRRLSMSASRATRLLIFSRGSLSR